MNDAIVPEDIWRLIFQDLMPQTDEYEVWRSTSYKETPATNVASLASTCRHLRLCGRPYLFRKLVFNLSEDDAIDGKGDAFWTSSTTRFTEILRNDEAKAWTMDLRFNATFESDRTPIMLKKTGFWKQFGRVLQHLSSLKRVTLNIPLEDANVEGYPLDLYRVLYPKKKQTATRKIFSIRGVDKEESTSPWSRTIPCKQDLTPNDANPTKVTFPGIRIAALSVSTYWILAHCPNLTKYISLSKFAPYNPPTTLTLLAANFSSLKALTLDLKACRSHLEEVAKAFLRVEELGMFPSFNVYPRCVFAVWSARMDLYRQEVALITPIIRSFPKLRVFALRNSQPVVRYLPIKEDAHLAEEWQNILSIIGNGSETLQTIHFGEVVLSRAEDWEGPPPRKTPKSCRRKSRRLY